MSRSRSLGGEDEDGDRTGRRALLAEIAADALETARWTGRPRFADRVMAAMEEVPRDLFVPETERPHAWINRPLPIGHQQTISQPFIVALMTDLIDPRPGQTVLEIGTGSGYQTAVLSRLVERVFSIERVPALAQSAAARLQRLGYDNIELRAGDGAAGWPESAPFDAILVTAAAGRLPETLIGQLAPDGIMVVPVGEQGAQRLMTVRRRADGSRETTEILPVAFVPLLSDMGE